MKLKGIHLWLLASASDILAVVLAIQGIYRVEVCFLVLYLALLYCIGNVEWNQGDEPMHHPDVKIPRILR